MVIKITPQCKKKHVHLRESKHPIAVHYSCGAARPEVPKNFRLRNFQFHTWIFQDA